MRRLWPLTVRGTGALILAIASFIVAGETAVSELMYFGILLLAALGASIGSLYLARRSDIVTRALVPDVSSVGRDARVNVRVGVRTAVPTPPGTWIDTIPHGLSGKAEGIFPALGSDLRGNERVVEFSYPIHAEARGIHSLGPLAVRSTDPFGLAHRSSVFGEKTPVTVAPAILDLTPLVDYAGAAGGSLHSTTNQLGQGSDNLVARPYVPGDSMRRIHWRATAHRDALMVRQEEQESTPEASVVLDRGAERWGPDAVLEPGADPGFELAVTACVSAVARLVRDGYAVEVLDTEGTVLAERIDGSDLTEVDVMLSHFATLTTRRDDGLARFPRLFSGVSTGPLILIAGRLESGDAEIIGPVANHSSLPLLFAVDPVGDALTRAADLGWRVGLIDGEPEFAAAWSTAVGRGVSHAFG
jgi:uncharacterized protein (DUF58 family)